MQYQLQTSQSRKAHEPRQVFSSKGNALIALHERDFGPGVRSRVVKFDPRTGAQTVIERKG